MGKPQRTFNVRLKDGTYELYFDNRALFEFEEKHGQMALKVLMSGEFGFRAITHFVWAGLLHRDKPVHLEKVKDIVEVNRMESITEVIIAALNDAFDTGDEPEPSSEKKATGRD